MDDYELIGPLGRLPDAPRTAVSEEEKQKPRTVPSVQPSCKGPKPLRDDDVDLNSNPPSKPMDQLPLQGGQRNDDFLKKTGDAGLGKTPAAKPPAGKKAVEKKPDEKGRKPMAAKPKLKESLETRDKRRSSKSTKEEESETEAKGAGGGKTGCRMLFWVGVVLLLIFLPALIFIGVDGWLGLELIDEMEAV